ncbi:MAG: HsmA family protein [Coriobacteriia bacterium]
MSSTLALASVLITLALVFYTLGVWAERLRRYLLPWHLAAFWLGLTFDTAGTYTMSLLTEGGLDWTAFHTWSGQVGIWLMAAHAIWATVVIRRGDERTRTTFHRYSLAVWLVWLVPYFGGMIQGMLHAR